VLLLVMKRNLVFVCGEIVFWDCVIEESLESECVCG
jgi:hypothetical protein